MGSEEEGRGERKGLKEWESDIKHQGANGANSPAHSFMFGISLSLSFPHLTPQLPLFFPLPLLSVSSFLLLP